MKSATETRPDESDDAIKVYIRGTKSTQAVVVGDGDTLSSLRREVSSVVGAPASELMMVHRGRSLGGLPHDTPLRELEIANSSTIHVALRCRGD
jgi:hypothetical protein